MQTLIAPEKDYEQRISTWDMLHDAKDRNKVLTGRVIALKRQETLDVPTWEIAFDDFPNVRGIVPYSETGLPTEETMNYFIDEPIKVRIKGIDKSSNLIACTRRELVEEALRKLLNVAKEGIEFDAPVIFATNARLGIDIGGGIVKIFSVANEALFRQNRPKELYEVDQTVRVIVKKVDKENGELEVAMVNPWDNDNINYLRGDIVLGKVVRLGPTYLLIAVQPGVVGIAPYPINSPAPRLDDSIKCKVNAFNKTKRDLSLTIFDPETIRGRRKNKGYWKNRRQIEQGQDEQAGSVVVNVTDHIEST